MIETQVERVPGQSLRLGSSLENMRETDWMGEGAMGGTHLGKHADR